MKKKEVKRLKKSNAIIQISKMVNKYTNQRDDLEKEKQKLSRKQKNLSQFLEFIRKYARDNIKVNLDDNLNIVCSESESESESNDTDLVNFDFSMVEKNNKLDSTLINDDEANQNELQ
ncbi:unnamed protein product [Brachionus calyciflorus]|uniref:Uncharacterized protein n=1 Tax=Brachionus calyciflorus TaxID=104777 RepID=A0A814CQS4_9BILA|nr:unnamed protein product [Brachionus calyciflorus]